jgi:hypothetical protein
MEYCELTFHGGKQEYNGEKGKKRQKGKKRLTVKRKEDRKMERRRSSSEEEEERISLLSPFSFRSSPSEDSSGERGGLIPAELSRGRRGPGTERGGEWVVCAREVARRIEQKEGKRKKVK